MTGNGEVFYLINKVICVLDVAGVEFGEGIYEMIYIFCNVVGFRPAVTD